MYTVDVEDNKIVFANSKNGNINFNCSGKSSPGDYVVGFIPGTQLIYSGVVATTEDAYDWVVGTLGRSGDAFKGDGKGAVIIDADAVDGGECSLSRDGINWVTTPHWRQVTSAGGTLKLYCHYME